MMKTDKKISAETDPETYAIIGAAMEVHSTLGCGFLEKVYHEALAIEFGQRSIPATHEVQLPIMYQGQRLKTHYRADFVCHQSIIVEIKAIHKLTKSDVGQVLNYLKATGYEVGLLINFGARSLEYHRITNPYL